MTKQNAVKMCEPEEQVYKRIEKFTELLSRLHAHIQQFTSNIDLTTELNEVEEEWLYGPSSYNQEVKKQESYHDLLFIIRCHILICQRGNLDRHPPVPVQRLPGIVRRLQVWGCNHVDVGIMSYPTEQELERFELDVAEMVVLHMSRLITPLPDANNEQQPDAWTVAVAQIKSLATKRRPRETDDEYSKRNKPVYGAYWDMDITTQFVPLASRVLNKLILDKRILDAYPIKEHEVEIVSSAMKLRMHEWYVEKCSLQMTDHFILQHRSIVFETLLPYNVRSVYARKLHQAAEQGALQVLDDMFGLDTASYISTLTSTPFDQVAGDPTHELYGINLLCVVHYFMRHKYPQLKLIGDQYAPIVLFANDVGNMHKQISKTKRFAFNARRPLLVQLKKQWFVHELLPEPHWTRCKDIVEAVLYWFKLVKQNYDDELDNGTRISSFTNLFVF